MNEFFADLHVHIGRAENNKPIKITAAKSLNFAKAVIQTPCLHALLTFSLLSVKDNVP